MGHNVGVAAERAVARSNRTKTEEKTPEQRLKDIRGLLAARLAVPPDEQRFLLERYDSIHETMVHQTASIKTGTDSFTLVANERDAALAHNAKLLEANGELLLLVGKLKEENEQFRTVYEQENSSRGTVVVVAEVPVSTEPTAAESFETKAERND